MIHKLLWWKKPHTRSATISFWKGEATHWMLKYKSQCLHCENLKGLIEERNSTITALRNELSSGKAAINKVKDEPEDLHTRGHA